MLKILNNGCFEHLNFGHCNLFGICNFEFVICYPVFEF